MIESKIGDRIEFLANKFDVFEHDGINAISKLKELEEAGYKPKLIEYENKLVAILSFKENTENERIRKHISVSFDVFSAMIAADPTANKSCVQWMLNVFTRFIREGDEGLNMAIRFVGEDLPQAGVYISLFEANKRKKKFKELCGSSYLLKGMSDPTDINQYKSLSQLFDAIDPFIERNPSELERLLQRYVDIGQAEIPVRDRKFTLFIPKTRDANVVFDKFANWCTAKEKNGMFDSYTKNNRKPDGRKSDIYIIINNQFFNGESQEVYQIHFETRQIKDRHNSQNVSIFESVIHESESMSNFFYEELIGMAKLCKTGLDNNVYLDHLIKFGFCESLFELIDSNSPTIRFMTREIPRMPDMTKFKSLEHLIIAGAGMVELHPSIGKLMNMEMLVLPNNKIKVLPLEIGNLKKLTFLNLTGNPLKEIPAEIKYLDKSNGGSLFRLAVTKKDIGEKNYQRLKELLPTTNIS